MLENFSTKSFKTKLVEYHEKVGPDGCGVDLWRDPRCGDRGSEVKIMILIIMMIDGGSHDGDHDGGHDGSHVGIHDGDHNGDRDGGNSNGSPTIEQ